MSEMKWLDKKIAEAQRGRDAISGTGGSASGPQGDEVCLSLEQATALRTQLAERTRRAEGWRCFHCGEEFTRTEDAAEHFGGTQASLAACQIKGHEHVLVGEIRKMEQELASYRNEDTNLLRAIATLQSEMAAATRRAEEEGYSKGLKDYTEATDALRARLAAAEEEIAGWVRYKQGIDEALNSGDGSYRP